MGALRLRSCDSRMSVEGDGIRSPVQNAGNSKAGGLFINVHDLCVGRLDKKAC